MKMPLPLEWGDLYTQRLEESKQTPISLKFVREIKTKIKIRVYFSGYLEKSNGICRGQKWNPSNETSTTTLLLHDF